MDDVVKALGLLLASLLLLEGAAALFVGRAVERAQAGRLQAASSTGYRRVDDGIIGASYEVPAGWVRDDRSGGYHPMDDLRFQVQVGFDEHAWRDANVLLPSGAVVLSEQTFKLGWGLATRYALVISGKPAAGRQPMTYEAYAFVLGVRGAYQITSSAPTDSASRGTADAALTHVLETFRLY